MLETTIEILAHKVLPEHTKGNIEGVTVDYVCVCDLDEEANIECSQEYMSGRPTDWLNIKSDCLLNVLWQLREKAEQKFQQILNSQLQLN